MTLLSLPSRPPQAMLWPGATCAAGAVVAPPSGLSFTIDVTDSLQMNSSDRRNCHEHVPMSDGPQYSPNVGLARVALKQRGRLMEAWIWLVSTS
jgi:hypothetical protein